MPVNPLVHKLGLQQVLERDAPKPPEAQEMSGTLTESALAGHIRVAWSRNKLQRFRVEEKMLRDLRARRGEYSAVEIANLQQSGSGMNIVWAPLTETKCRAASAWIREIVLPVGEQPWGVDPSPVPDLPFPLKNAIVNKALAQATQTMQQIGASGGGVMSRDEFKDLAVQVGDKLKADAEKTMVKLAKDRADRMEAVIGDRLVDGGYAAAMDDFVEDFTTYAAAHLKGPFYTFKKQLTWDKSWKPVVKAVPVQTWARVAPFDAYPAPGATSPQQGDFIERMRYRRDELFDLKGLPGYKDDQIDKALRDYSGGRMEGWLWTEGERTRLEQETSWNWLAPEGVIDALNYWGSVPGWKLKTWGVTGDFEETRDYQCNVLLCGRYVLYAALNPDPMGRRPYRKACYDAIPGAYWGRSIPDLMSSCQQFCNAAACALADNLSIASGPQVWVHADRFADGEQTLELFPWKIWQLKSDQTQGVNPGIGFFQPDDRSGPLLGVYEKWELKADDATGIPRYTYGNENSGGSADTATGLSMLMNNAAKGLRRAISNIDMNVISPTIYDTFVNEMQYNPDQSIKGDCTIVPRGAAAILIRESAQQRRLQFLTLTANPIDAPLIGGKCRLALLRETAAALDLPVDEVVPTDEEFEANQAAAAQQQQQMLAAQAQQEQQKEQAIGDREQASQQTQALTQIVQSAVTAAMSKGQGDGAAAAGAPAQPGAVSDGTTP